MNGATTVAELIAYLRALPPDTEVSVIEGYDCGYHHGTREIPLNLDPINGNVDFTDFSANHHIKQGHVHFNRKFLVLGEK